MRTMSGEPDQSMRERLIALTPGAMEAVLFLMIGLSPWVYGAVHPEFEFILMAGVGLLLVLWAGRMLLTWQVNWQPCPVAWSLALLLLLGICQVTPLSRPALEWLS